MNKKPLEIIINETESKLSYWNKIEFFSKIFALIAIPLIIAYFANSIQKQISVNSLNKDYVQIAITVLSKSPTKNDEDLREWAIQLLQHYSPIKFSEKLKRDLKTGLISLNETNEIIIMTKSGKLEIKKENNYNHKIILNNKVIKVIQNFAVYIKYAYNFKESTIVVIESGSLGSSTYPNYFIFEFYKNKAPFISQELYSETGTFIESINKKNKLIIDLGFNSGVKEIIEYQNSKLEKKYIKIDKTQNVDDEICNSLYNIYTDAYSGYFNQQCTDMFSSPMSTLRAIIYYENDPRIDIKLLENITIKACKEKETIEYSIFKKQMCQGKK